MRKFDYTSDYSLIRTTVRGYIMQLERELSFLITLEKDNNIYIEAYKDIKKIKEKYPDLDIIYNKILNDLLSPYNVEYCYKNGRYPGDASSVGKEFEKDIKDIFKLEEKVREYSVKIWERDITNYDNIENGEDFLVVAHAAYLLPGTKEDKNYRGSKYNSQYLSCSLFSNLELNSFNGMKTLFVMEVNDSSYIASSSIDSVTSDDSRPSFNTLKEINIDGERHYIKVGYTNDSNKSVTSISTPRIIEKLSVERELKASGELYRYNSLTNEVILDRRKTRTLGALLLSDGCDLLLNEYISLKQLGVKFKCINKGLYRQKANILPYNEEEYNNFLLSLEHLDDIITQYRISNEILSNYYYEVVIPMKYDERVMTAINKKISKYIPDISSGMKR